MEFRVIGGMQGKWMRALAKNAISDQGLKMSRGVDSLTLRFGLSKVEGFGPGGSLPESLS